MWKNYDQRGIAAKKEKEMNLNHIAFSISDERDISGFYENILGMEKARRFALNAELAEKIFAINKETQVYLMKSPDVVMEIFINPEPEEKGFHHICISLKNREEAVRKAVANRYAVTRIEREKFDLIFIRDKSGNIFEIKEEAN